jgi:ribosomal protein L19E
MSIAEYVRRTTLNKKISSTSKIHLANSLSKLGGLQVKLNQQLRDEINRSGSSDVITNLIADHNRLYREICNAVREARNGDTGN